MEIKQEAHNFKAEIKCLENLIAYKLKKDSQEIEAYIPYEEISNDKVKFSQANVYSLVIGIVCLSLFAMVGLATDFSSTPIFMVGTLVAGISGLAQYFRSKKRFHILKTAKYNLILLDNPEGNGFINEIVKRKNEYLREKYGKINWENETQTELNRFAILKQQGVLSEEEFEDLKRQLLK